MRLRLALALAAAITGLIIALLASFASSASAAVYCLPGVSDSSCTNSSPTIDAAFTSATSNGTADTIRLGAATYPIANAAGLNDNSGGAIHLIGAGQGATTITGTNNPATNQTYLTLGANSPSSVSDLTILLPAGANADSTDTALSLFTSATATDVTISGPTANNGKGVYVSSGSFTNGTIDLPQTATIGASMGGAGTIADSTITAQSGIDASNNSAPSPVISRVVIHVVNRGIYLDGGTVNIDDTLVDLGSGMSAVGLDANNSNPGVLPKTLNARHVTIVGGGANSIGARALATAPGAAQTSTLNLSDSIIAGPVTSIYRGASNGVAGTSVANVTTDHSNYDSAAMTSSNGSHGSGTITEVAPTNLAPGFAAPGSGDYSLAATSALIDAGNPAAGGPVTDLAGEARVVDGDGDGSVVRDIGAYEFQPPVVVNPDPPDPPATPDTTPPDTTFAQAVKRKLKGSKLKVAFASTEAGSHFECKLDGASYAPCTSPLQLKRIKRGKHTFSVRAIDAAGNVDASPATAKFKRPKKRKR